MKCPSVFCFQAEDGIRDLVRSRGLGDVYKRQGHGVPIARGIGGQTEVEYDPATVGLHHQVAGLDLSLIHI